MPSSLLLEKLSRCLRTGADLLLRRVATREHSLSSEVRAGPKNASVISGGVGVAVAAPVHPDNLLAPPALNKRLLISDQDDSPSNTDFDKPLSQPDPDKLLSSEEFATRVAGILVGVVTERDRLNTRSVLSHVTKAPEPSMQNVKLPELQEAVILARTAVLDAMISEQLNGEAEDTSQVVLLAPGLDARIIERQDLPSPLSVFAVNDATMAHACEKDADRVQSLLQDGIEYVHVQAVLEGWVWDSGLVLHGYNWQKRSVWVLQLDVSDICEESLERHFRMIGTLASPGSVVLAVYVTPGFVRTQQSHRDEWKGPAPTFSCADPFRFGKKCSFQVEFATTLRDAALNYQLPEDLQAQLSASNFSDGVRFAIFSHSEQSVASTSHSPDVLSEITAYSSFSTNASRVPSVVSSAAPALGTVGDQSSLSDFQVYVNSDKRRLHFELQLSTLPRHLALPEYSMVLIGSEAAVGCWDPKRAKKLHGDITAIEGVLSTDFLLSVDACDVEYKYAVTNARQEIIAWEVGYNRRLPSPANQGSLRARYVQRIRDEWRCF